MIFRCRRLSPDARLFAVGGEGVGIVLFDVGTGKERQRLPSHPSRYSLAFSPDGKTLVAADWGGCIDLWDVVTGKPDFISPEPNGHWQVQFTSKGTEVLSTGDHVIWWDTKSAKPVRRLPRSPDWPYPPIMSSDGKLMAASLLSGDLVLINAATGEVLHSLTRHVPIFRDTMAFSPDCRQLYSAGRNDPRIVVWDVQTGKSKRVLQHSSQRVDRTCRITKWALVGFVGK